MHKTDGTLRLGLVTRLENMLATTLNTGLSSGLAVAICVLAVTVQSYGQSPSGKATRGQATHAQAMHTQAMHTQAPQPAPAPQVDAQTLVRRAAANAAANAQDASKLFMYRASKESNSGTSVRDMVETKDVILARTITWNGEVPSAEERAKEDARLYELVTDAEELSKKKADQDADRKRTLQLVRALPDALQFTYDGAEMVHGREAFRLKFTPNPGFSPTSKETYGLKAAAGTLWVDKEYTQIVRMDATLMENVYIGWGILGHIDKGGRLELEQSLLPGNAWRISKLNIDATGKVFFFKSIRIKQRQSGWDYRPVPSDLTIAQAVAALKQPAAISPQRAATR